MKSRLPNGYNQGGGSMQSIIQQAKKMQEDAEALQADLDAREYDISAGGGAVSIRINGKKEILALDIKPEIVDPDDVEMLSDILIAGINEAIKKVETVNAEEMQKVTGQMSMPGLF